MNHPIAFFLVVFVVAVRSQCPEIPIGYRFYNGKCSNISTDGQRSYPSKFTCYNYNNDPLACKNLCEATNDCTGFETHSDSGMAFCHIIDDVHPDKSHCAHGWSSQPGNGTIFFQGGDGDPNTCCYQRLKGAVHLHSFVVGTGTAFLLILSGIIFTYVFVGTVYNWTVEGKSGFSAFPNHSFWSELLGSAKDGCRFSASIVTGGRYAPNFVDGYRNVQGEDEEARL